MPNSKISALTAATTPVAGTETLPIVQGGVTKQVSIANLTAGRAVSAASLALTTPLPTTSGGTGLASFTANQVFYASSTSAIGQSANFTWDGTSLVAGGTSNSTPGIIVRQSNSNNGVFRLGQTGKIYAILGGDYQGAMELFTESGAGDILFTVAGTTRGRMNSSGFKPIAGNGIDYSANTAAAGMTSQLLNWYEEGNWTPSITGWTVVGTPTITGKFTRIGRLVTFHAFISHTTSTQSVAGTSYIKGLPYTPAADSSCIASSNATDVGYGTGSVSGSNTTDQIYPPSVTLGANQVLTVTGTYYV